MCLEIFWKKLIYERFFHENKDREVLNMANNVEQISKCSILYPHIWNLYWLFFFFLSVYTWLVVWKVQKELEDCFTKICFVFHARKYKIKDLRDFYNKFIFSESENKFEMLRNAYLRAVFRWKITTVRFKHFGFCLVMTS